MNRFLYALVLIFTFPILPGQPEIVGFSQDAIALSNLKKAKENYERAGEDALKKWEENINNLIKAPKQGLSITQTIERNLKLKKILELGVRYDSFPDTDLALEPAAQFYASLDLPRWKLYLAYERMNRELESGKFNDPDQKAFQEEAKDFMRRTEKLDKIKPGTHFYGEQHDPALNVTVPIHLEITERNGFEFRGKMDLNNGAAVLNVLGSIRGLHLEMKKVGVMVKGGERYLECYGYAVGNRLLLNMRGIGTAKKKRCSVGYG